MMWVGPWMSDLNAELDRAVRNERKRRVICNCPDRRPKQPGAEYCDVCTGLLLEINTLLKVGR